MTLTDALAVLAPAVPDGTVCIHANGHIGRAGCAARDRDESFYMIGSMGLASSIGAEAPPNLLHVCFDNGAHASTGAQPTITDRVRLDEVARAAGYRFAGRVETRAALAAEAPRFLGREGPAFLLVRIALGPPGPPAPRIPHAPEAMTARLRRALGTGR